MQLTGWGCGGTRKIISLVEIPLPAADPLRASLRSVGWHGKLQKKRNSRPQPTAAHLAAR